MQAQTKQKQNIAIMQILTADLCV